ncbi:hypothetical protein DNTS_025373 [Danionella cerebrum]|uniref:DUF4706 domain-containing protein n=1 Tax=Danionella cerebrum TaxID=2873325 RepID=A0A553RDH6_9TELE|nr:hypothetical protein DNTS_025373 [Danionella translucida]
MAASATATPASPPRLTEAKKMEYFASINSMARKIIQERVKIKEGYGLAWEQMSPVEQDAVIDNGMMDPRIRARYAMHRVERDDVVCYPRLLLHTGQKIVHFGEEDLTWQDEHSAPFSWETKSQMEFSLVSSITEPVSVNEQKPKSSQTPKLPANDESAFWKLSAERSRLDGEKAEFPSLTPSQIKSLEKGEKPIPLYLRSEPGSKSESEEAPIPRPVKQRAPKPPAPLPPMPITMNPSVSRVAPMAPAPVAVLDECWERAQSTLPSVSSTTDEVFSPGLVTSAVPLDKTPGREVDVAEVPSVSHISPSFSQFNTSSSILKTGFDFLDNW